MQAGLHYLKTLFTFILFSVVTTNAIGQATVTSDKDDYAARSTATFTGAGFEPFETVTLKVKNLTQPCNTVSADSSYLPWTVEADSAGGFVTTWIVCDCPGDSLRLKATGMSSGLIAYAYFTDAGTQLSVPVVTPNQNSAPYGSIITLSSTLTQQGNDPGCGACVGNNQPIPNKLVTFTINNNAVTFGSGTTNNSGVASISAAVTANVGNYNGANNRLTASFAGDATPYTQSSRSVNFQVTQATTTITNVSGSGVYGESVTLTATANLNVSGIQVNFTLDGTPVGNAPTSNTGVATLTVAAGSIPVSVRNAGTHLAKVGASITGTTNYTAGSGSGNLIISQRPISVTADAKTKVYGQADPALTYTFSPDPATSTPPAGLAYTDAFSGALTRAAGENVGTYAITQGTLKIVSGVTDVSANYSISFIGANLTITTRPITITADPQTKVYGQPDPTLTYTSTTSSNSPPEGLATGDVFDGALARAPGENIGTYAINQGTLVIKKGAVDVTANYNITFNSANLTITQRPITISADPQTKVYGETDPTLTYSITPDPATTTPPAGLAFTDAVSGALTRAAGENIGTYAITQGALTIKNGAVDVSANYTITFNGADLTITKRPITISADPQTKVYGETDPTLTYTITPDPATTTPPAGLAFTDAVSGALTRATGENIGTYAITQGTLTIKNGAVDVSANYTITFNGADLTITKRPITISADPQTKVYGAADPTLTYTISPDPATITPPAGLAFSDVVSGALTRTSGENIGTYAITQGTLTIKNGAVDVSANYTITFNGADLTITKRPITINADPQSKVYGQTDPALTYTISPDPATTTPPAGLAFTDAVSGALTRASGENIGTYAITQGTLTIKNGAVDVSANYTITFNGADLTITQRPITITANPQTKVYGEDDPTLTYSYTPFNTSPAVGLAPGDAFDGALGRAAGENIGTYAINQGTLIIKKESDNVTANYAITFNPANLTITQRPITITANPQTKVYGQSDPTLSYTNTAYSNTPPQGLASGDVFSGALGRASGEDIGTYAINQGTLVIKKGPDDVTANYAITFNPANLTITKRPITITPNSGQFKYHGDSDPTLQYTSTPFSNSPAQGLAPGDAFDGALGRAVGELVGFYLINQGNLTIKKGAVDVSNNYTITFTTGVNFEIKPLSVSSGVTVSPTSQQYSDLVTFTATITGGAPKFVGGPQAAASATFKVGTQVMGTANFVVSGADIVATLSNVALVEGVAGQMSPGSKTVTATINSPNNNFTISNLYPTTSLTITQEDARITYTGLLNVATTSPTSTTVNLTLAATIQDISATGDAGSDTYSGDIRNAKVTFINRDNNTVIAANVPVGLVNPGDLKTGTATYNWSLTLPSSGTVTIGIIVSNYYVRNSSSDNVVINMYQPNGEFITGGGYLILTNSNGQKPGDPGTKMNFGFNVKYNKSGTNLQGNMNIIFRRIEGGVLQTYQIKGTSMTNLNVKPVTNPSEATPSTATFNSKANIQNITNPLAPINCDGGSLIVTLSDAGEPGKFDKIGIVLYNKQGGVWFSSNWNGTQTINQLLGGGNLVVHGVAVGSSGTSSNSVVSTVDPSTMLPQYDKFDAKVLGNPSFTYFTVQVQSTTNDPVEIKMVDMLGKTVRQYRGAVGENIKVGHTLTQGMYYIQVFQGTNRKVISVIKK